jgi:hypothetical protein
MPNNFQEFHGRLTAALNSRAAAGYRDDTDPTCRNHAEPIHVFLTHFGSKYGVRAPSKPYISPTASARNPISNVSPRLSNAEWKKVTLDEENRRRTCFKCGQKGQYSGDPTCTRSENSMTDSSKARYRVSVSDSMASSTILFEIAVSIEEEDRYMREDTKKASINFFYHIVHEYKDAVDSNAQSDMTAQNFGQPSTQ